MNGTTTRLRSSSKKKSAPSPTNDRHFSNGAVPHSTDSAEMIKKRPSTASFSANCVGNAHFLKWRAGDVLGVLRYHPVPCAFAAGLLFFMAVEYTLTMIPPMAEPFDLGYILWTWLIEGRPRATISALFMFTCRGILGYATQLPLPEGFLGSGADFPVGNVSFFLFYSGHVAASIIASLDMKRMQRWELAYAFDALNVLQVVRLLSTRGHYTIDLAVGVGAGILFDSLAGKYEDSKKTAGALCNGTTK
ncbi:hypothetical protein DH2020_016503 [Rehmannia glutinosa]|uniref:AtPDCT1/2 transmembrane domain-containing protein n=1 Tax=Rehmannia glutinosa TaxID=99300 RepID=A0ABR0WN70_REHGL